MHHTDNNMSPSRSEPSHSPPSSPPLSSVIPTPPPPPPLPLLAPPHQSTDPQTPPPNYLTVFHGNLTSFLRSSFRQKKWALVLILPRASSFSAPTSPTLPPSPRPAWGPGARHQPNRLEAPEHITDNVMLWRRTIGSSDAENYKAFFPVDGHPHFALLDPRSGERLIVWGNVDGENMTAPTKVDDQLWSQILSDLKDFIQNHSLENDALGPAHYQEKSWAVRTRRVSESSGAAGPNLPSTSVMDDEEAAIAAAIAASLQQSNPPSAEQEHNHDNVLSDDYSLDGDDSSELFTSDDMSDNGNSTDGTSQEDVSARSDISNENVEDDHDMGVPIRSEHRTRSQPIPIPSRGQEATPSSVESVSLSYIERMESCLRSRTDPNLMAARKLKEQQDEELAMSLEADQRRERLEMEIATKQAMDKEQKLSAAARLPDEPAEGAAHAVSIALRLPGGARLVRRFNNFDGLKSVADFVIAEAGYTQVLGKSPQQAFRIPGGKLPTHDWNVDIGSLGLGKRAMFVVHID